MVKINGLCVIARSLATPQSPDKHVVLNPQSFPPILIATLVQFLLSVTINGGRCFNERSGTPRHFFVWLERNPLRSSSKGCFLYEHAARLRDFFCCQERMAAEIAELFRGFLTTLGGKRAGVLRDAHKTAAD